MKKKRILNRSLAKELSPEELAKTNGYGTISCVLTGNACDPNDSDEPENQS